MLGEHDVPDEIIEYNFHEGIQRVQCHLHLFDNITFIDGNSNYGEIVAIYIKRISKHEVTTCNCTWFNKYFSRAFDNLKIQ